MKKSKLVDPQIFHILSNKSCMLRKMRGPRNTLKYDAWKPVLGTHLGNHWRSGTHIRGETLRRRASRQRERKLQTKLFVSLADC